MLRALIAEAEAPRQPGGALGDPPAVSTLHLWAMHLERHGQAGVCAL